MKHLFFVLICCLSARLAGQLPPKENLIAEIAALHQAGKSLAERADASSFDKLTAYGKFRRSQSLLDKSGADTHAIYQENEAQIQALAAWFARFSNRDSLLRLSRFYPDSVFLADKRYPQKLRSFIKNYLDQRKRTARAAFYKIDGLNIPKTKGVLPLPFESDFENYWPLELLELENELAAKERLIAGSARTVREALITEHFQQKFDLLNEQITLDSAYQIIQQVKAQRDKSEASLLDAQRLQRRYWYIGLGFAGLIAAGSFLALRKNQRLLQNMNQTLLEEKKRSEDLLLNILPAEVARQLKNKAAARAYRYEQASVLFSDFQGFSKIAEQLSPEELVAELDYCFTAFDRIVDKYHLQKIKTIGDAYMCVGGMYTQGANHVLRMVLAALEMQHFLADLKQKRLAKGQHFFEARIGIHTGPVVAGVIGAKKFAFDVWGDTVNVAQQLEARCEAGRVNISRETYELVKDRFPCEQRGKIAGKHGKEMEMYFVSLTVDG